MATTETRSGFRLPWSTDRPANLQAEEGAAWPVEPVETPEGVEAAGAMAEPVRAQAEVAWPEGVDPDARLGITPREARVDPAPEPAAEAEPEPEPGPAADAEPELALAEAVTPPVVRAEAPVLPRKSAKLVADLTAAIRATAEAARDQAFAQIDGETAEVVETIRSRSKPGEVVLRQRSDDEIAEVREWSKVEIARIKDETDARITARRAVLAEELAVHSAGIERRVGEVQGVAEGYRAELAAYGERIGSEQDPAKLATLAETMPEPPAFDAWLDFEDGQLDEVAALPADAAVAVVPAPVDSVDEHEPPAAFVEPVGVEPHAPESEVGGASATEMSVAAVDRAVEPIETPESEPFTTELPSAETIAAKAQNAPGSGPGSAEARWAAIAAGSSPMDSVPQWASGETPDGFPAVDAGTGDPVDRGAIMAALEAAAEAVVAAESAAESADQAQAAAGVAETAAEILAGRAGYDDLDPEAQAAMAARVDAGGFDTESFADRLAALFPGHDGTTNDGLVHSTQVVVTGLVSVASIASFKRHLGRLPGVQSVTVASGSEGEFLFGVTHAGAVSFRDAIPSMPGFAARVTSVGDGVVTVAARDPEGE